MGTNALSALGQLVLFLHRLADEEGRLQVKDKAAKDIIAVLEGAPVSASSATLTEGQAIGLELKTGALTSEKANNIRTAAIRRLRNYDTFLRCVEELGYLPQLVKAALVYHYDRLKEEELGSTGHCVLMDLQKAVSQCDKQTQQVVAILASGLGPQQVGAALNVNGSRRVGEVIRRLSRLLEGGDGKTKKRRRRRKPKVHNANNG